MVRLKKFIISLIILSFVLSTSVLANENFYIKTSTMQKDVFLGDPAIYNISITNLLEIDDVYSLSTVSSDWIITPSGITIPTGTAKELSVQLKSGSNVLLGVHGVETIIESARTGETQKALFLVNIKPFDPVFGKYRPSVVLTVDMNKEVDPRKDVELGIYLKNRNSLDIKDLQIKIDGELFSKEYSLPLGPLEEKREELLFPIDDLETPGLHNLNVLISVKNVTLSQTNKNYEVKPYSVVSMDKETKTAFCKSKKTITLHNNGNVEKTQQVKLKVSWLKNIITSTSPDAKTIKEDGERYLSWDVVMQPDETLQLYVTHNYQLPILAILVIILLIIAYYRFRSPILILKDAYILGSKSSGEKSELKIRLFLKNRSRKEIPAAKLVDRVLSIAEFQKQKQLGTLHPTKISHSQNKGTIITWDLEMLEPFEERIVTYEVKSKLQIIGTMNLPAAKINFKHRDKERTVYSNKVLV